MTSIAPSDLETRIRTTGREVFEKLGSAQPSLFSKSYHAARLMEWSMKDPAFKTSLFRLVDVLPTLRSQAAIAKHVHEYLAGAAENLGGLLGWGLGGASSSVRTRVAAMFVRNSVKQMAQLFIAGEGPKDALPRLAALRKNGLAFTVDLLGEYSVSEPEALAYLQRYKDALLELSAQRQRLHETPLIAAHPADQTPVCVSVKLSALYSQCGPLNFDRSVAVLSERLSELVRIAKETGASLYVDAEDSGNNPIIYETFKRVFSLNEFIDFPLPGAVVQAYAKNAEATVEDLLSFARKRGGQIAIRLVKGAYWDQETTLAQQMHWESPLWSRKEQSDAHFEKLSRLLIDNHEVCLPAFASHNIRSLTHACVYAQAKGLSVRDFELQMLFGMAEPIAKAYSSLGYLVRLYVPLGNLIVGMGYLVRRLLENTSNESFLKHTFHDSEMQEQLLQAPRPE